MLLSILSCTKPILVPVPAGWWKCQRAPASVQHPRPDLWHQQGGPGPSAGVGLHFHDVQRSAGPTSSPCGWKHCDCRGGCPSRRQQLAIRGWRFLQLGLRGKQSWRQSLERASLRGLEPQPPAMTETKGRRVWYLELEPLMACLERSKVCSSDTKTPNCIFSLVEAYSFVNVQSSPVTFIYFYSM